MDTLALPFDQYQRYRLVADVVDRLRPDGAPLRILDVGGRTGLLRGFLPADRIVLVDLEPSQEPELVLGDGSALPFRSGAFDLVAAFDTLEHVPPPQRAAFVRECARVSRAWVVLAGPYQSAEVDEAEEDLRAFLEHKLRTSHRYLDEHRSHGLPSRAETLGVLREAGAAVGCVGHGNLERWLALMCMELYMDADPLLRPVAERFFRFYNRLLYPSDHRAPVYRHLVLGALGGRTLPELEGLLDAPVAPEGSTRALTELAEELLAFDREQDVWRPELERLRGIIADLEQDLEGHRARLRDREQDLEAHRLSLSDHQRDLALEREERGREQAAARALEQELRGSLAAEEAARLATIEHLHQTEAGAQAIQKDLLASLADSQRLAAELRARDERVAGLEAQLRDRWGNLKRAFSRKRPPPPP